VGSDGFSENVILANRVSGASRKGKKRKLNCLGGTLMESDPGM
jgi:hypothetical protein